MTVILFPTSQELAKESEPISAHLNHPGHYYSYSIIAEVYRLLSNPPPETVYHQVQGSLSDAHFRMCFARHELDGKRCNKYASAQGNIACMHGGDWLKSAATYLHLGGMLQKETHDSLIKLLEALRLQAELHRHDKVNIDEQALGLWHNASFLISELVRFKRSFLTLAAIRWNVLNVLKGVQVHPQPDDDDQVAAAALACTSEQRIAQTVAVLKKKANRVLPPTLRKKMRINHSAVPT